MKKMMILSALTLLVAGAAVQKASAGVVVSASFPIPGVYAPNVYVGSAYSYPAPAYTYTPNYAPAPAYGYCAPPVPTYAPAPAYVAPPVVYSAPVISAPVIGIRLGPVFHGHYHHHGHW